MIAGDFNTPMKRILIGLVVLVVVTRFWITPSPSITQAQRPDAPSYALRGSHPVGVVDVVVENGERPLNVTMWYPALNPDGVEEVITYQMAVLQREGQALRDAAPDIEGGPFPVIYFSHGLGGARLQSTFYTEHLASWGFIVLAADHPGSTFFDLRGVADPSSSVIQSFGYRPLEIMRLIQYSDELNAAGDYAGLFDMDNLAVTGHSFGGYTSLAAGGASVNSASLADSCDEPIAEGRALCADLENQLQTMAEILGLDAVPDGLWPTFTDSRIKAVVPLAPAAGDIFGAEGMAGLTAPLMVIAGTSDHTTPAETNGVPAFKDAGSEIKSLVLLQNADHNVFVDACNEQWIQLGLFNACSDSVWDMTRVHDLIMHFSTAFFLAHLKGDADAANALLPGAVDFVGVEYQTAGS